MPSQGTSLWVIDTGSAAQSTPGNKVSVANRIDITTRCYLKRSEETSLIFAKLVFASLLADPSFRYASSITVNLLSRAVEQTAGGTNKDHEILRLGHKATNQYPIESFQ